MYQIHGTSSLYGPKKETLEKTGDVRDFKDPFMSHPGLIAGIAAAGMILFCSLGGYVASRRPVNRGMVLENRVALPKVERNQSMILHPDYLNGQADSQKEYSDNDANFLIFDRKKLTVKYPSFNGMGRYEIVLGINGQDCTVNRVKETSRGYTIDCKVEKK